MQEAWGRAESGVIAVVKEKHKVSQFERRGLKNRGTDGGR